MRLLAGEEQGGDNHANDNDDDADNNNLVAGLPPAAPEGTPPSQFPSDIVRHRVPAAPPATPTPAPAAGARGQVAVVQVTSRPMTLTVVDRSLAAAAASAAATAATADGGSMDDGADIASRLQSDAASAGAKPKKPRHTRKYQVLVIIATDGVVGGRYTAGHF